MLDASALLALLRQEPGAQAVVEAMAQKAAISVVNWAEVLSKMSDLGMDPDEVVADFRQRGTLGVDLVVLPMGSEVGLEIARLRPLTRQGGLSLGDRACLCLARSLGVSALTTERTWAELRLEVSVQVIR